MAKGLIGIFNAKLLSTLHQTQEAVVIKCKVFLELEG